MKRREVYADLRVLSPAAIRIDGRNFGALSLEKPYDHGFAEALAATCEGLIRDSGLNPTLAYTFSDEINLIFKELPFDGRVEKLDSITASWATSSLTQRLNMGPLSMDARAIQLDPASIIQYLQWRQAEAWRNHIHSYAFYALLSEGLGRDEAAKILQGMKSPEIHEFMFQRGVNLAETPTWQRRGILVYRVEYEVEGVDPRTGEKKITKRTRVVQDWEPPQFTTDEGKELIEKIFS